MMPDNTQKEKIKTFISGIDLSRVMPGQFATHKVHPALVLVIVEELVSCLVTMTYDQPLLIFF